MANKKCKPTKAEIEQKEIERQTMLKVDYVNYVSNMEARIKAGETLIIKEFEDWVRVSKKVIDGEEVEIMVAGDSGETKNARFLRLAKARMTSCLHELGLIINLSGIQYESTKDQQEKIVNALRLKVLDIENSFKSEQTKLNTFDF